MTRLFSSTVVVAAGVVLLSVGVAGAQVGRETSGRDAGALRVYTGISNQGDIQEALDDAVARALRALPGADRMVQYRVRDITGEQGGIRGANILRVTIEVTGDEVRPPRRGQDGPPERPAEAPRRGVRAELSFGSSRVAQGGTADLELTVRNPSDQPVRIPLATMQKYDFEVFRDGRLVWRWSRNRAFAPAATAVLLPPRGSATYRTAWDLRNTAGVFVPPGQYQVRAYLATRGTQPRIGASATLTITER